MSGVRSMRTGIDSINRLKSSIKSMPLKLRTGVAKDAAGYLDIEVRAEFNAGKTVFDEPRPLGVDGEKLSLVFSGKTKSALGFDVTGTLIRAVLGQRYAKFLVGRYRILPQKLPPAWAAHITRIVEEWQAEARDRGLL